MMIKMKAYTEKVYIMNITNKIGEDKSIIFLFKLILKSYYKTVVRRKGELTENVKQFL